MAEVIIYSTAFCPYCVRARMLLDSKAATYHEIRVDLEPQHRREMEQKSARTSVPQIFIDDLHIGGFTELYALECNGDLDLLLHSGNQAPKDVQT
jgi:glutaredoxin 3